ncbi:MULTISPECIES: 50S ribosomal protein L29 [Deinococcus]|uniref:Large ribosomal subunit protein uL29 n=1 Tax=Deinococcus ruber TaxID=1848197 RepID=A0A918C4E4_9DEIO|nr:MULTISPECIES: 50S ribosomal protein L29 [Deinococcus]ULH14878.1 50S ribosomal protein L29 [Deinococcus sp. KNUC1210]GGR04297.1 50S ribosomal protein L29 [Deinococcus ruber]
MKLSEMRELDAAAFGNEVTARKKELMELRFQGAVGNLEKPHRVAQLRREIAQLLTIQGEHARSK